MKVRFGEDAEPSTRRLRQGYGEPRSRVRSPEESCESGYLLLVRLVGVARGFAFAVLRTVIVPSRAIAGVGDASGYFFVEGQMRRHG